MKKKVLIAIGLGCVCLYTMIKRAKRKHKPKGSEGAIELSEEDIQRVTEEAAKDAVKDLFLERIRNDLGL